MSETMVLRLEDESGFLLVDAEDMPDAGELNGVTELSALPAEIGVPSRKFYAEDAGIPSRKFYAADNGLPSRKFYAADNGLPSRKFYAADSGVPSRKFYLS